MKICQSTWRLESGAYFNLFWGFLLWASVWGKTKYKPKYYLHNRRDKWSNGHWGCIVWEKNVFYKWVYNSIFELQWPFATHYISTPMSAIGQVTWVARDVTHHIYNHILMQLIITLSQLIFNYYATPLWLQP
jgi:hypothetical protein